MRPLRIVVADDEPCVRALVAACLTQLNHTVVAVADGAELVAACRAGEFDLVVSDVQMPVLDGIAAAEVIRRESGRPVILLSAGWTPELMARARAAGAFCLDKPVRPSALQAAVQTSRRQPAAAD